MASSFVTRLGKTTLRHRRAVQPLHFPDSEPEELRVPEGKPHVELKVALYAILKRAYSPENSVGCDQFVYFNARDPSRKCAPDGFVKLGVPDAMFRSWKTWERGAPELAIEIDCSYDGKRLAWEERLARLWEVGVREIVRFAPEAEEGARLRAWDRIEDDLVERVVEGDSTPCVTLDLAWVVRPLGEFAIALRLARDAAGKDLLLTPIEAAERERDAALSKVAELEAELRRR